MDFFRRHNWDETIIKKKEQKISDLVKENKFNF